MIIFVRTKSATDELAQRLRSRGFAAQAINGDLNQAQRERVIAQLRRGDLDLLVATDVAARGLDVDRISHVVNFDIPTDTESYIHRVGRTGRAGRQGEALLFVTPRERGLLRAIEKATRQPLTERDLPSVADVNARRVSRFYEQITEALGNPAQSALKGLVLDYAREYEVPMADVAAALAVLSRADPDLLLPTEPGPPAEEKPPTRRATYRMSVGRRHRVNPSQIVGALINEGGLSRDEIGKIDIRADHTVVELPARLPERVTEALSTTRIGRQPIELRPERRPPRRRG
jgi:ATP-dependent RNA helicase DeaD